MQSPIYLLYSLDNFYQNHRRYVQSKSPDQLQGKIIDVGKARSSCHPIVLNRDLHRKYAWDNKTLLDPNAVANPCGLIGTYSKLSQLGPSSTTPTRCSRRMGAKYKSIPKTSRYSMTTQESTNVLPIAVEFSGSIPPTNTSSCGCARPGCPPAVNFTGESIRIWNQGSTSSG